MDWNELRERLAKPFPPKAIAWVPVKESREQDRALVAPYIERWRIEDRLDAVVGVENWHAEYEHVQIDPNEFKVRCRLTIHGVTKENVGEWSSLSGAYTKAFRRVAENFGIGRHVRALEPQWVSKGANGKYQVPKRLKGRIVEDPTEEDLAASEHTPQPSKRRPAAVRPPGSSQLKENEAKSRQQNAGAPQGRLKDPIELINQLVGTLKERGKGAEAAQIIINHGGYGKTPEQQKILYGKLRRLLVKDEAA